MKEQRWAQMLDKNIAWANLARDLGPVIAKLAAQYVNAKSELSSGNTPADIEQIGEFIVSWNDVVQTAPNAEQDNPGLHLSVLRHMRGMLLDNEFKALELGQRTILRSQLESYGRLFAEEHGTDFIQQSGAIQAA